MSKRVVGIESIRRADEVRPGNQEVSTMKVVEDVQWTKQEIGPLGDWRPVEVRINFTDGTSKIRLAGSKLNVIIQDAGAY